MYRSLKVLAAIVGLALAGCGSSNAPKTCLAGYEKVGTTCVDIDECALATDDCAANADCTNT
jgi:hypothetical protein